MNYKPKIRITGSLSDEDGDSTMEITAEATVIGTETEYEIEYDEEIVPGYRTHTVLRVCGDTVSIIRTGDTVHVITAESGKRHICHYSMPFGEIVFAVYGTRVKSSVNENGGTLEIEYELSYPNGQMTVNEMKIEIYPEGVGINE